jgi:hypothetical protein
MCALRDDFSRDFQLLGRQTSDVWFYAGDIAAGAVPH